MGSLCFACSGGQFSSSFTHSLLFIVRRLPPYYVKNCPPCREGVVLLPWVRLILVNSLRPHPTYCPSPIAFHALGSRITDYQSPLLYVPCHAVSPCPPDPYKHNTSTHTGQTITAPISASRACCRKASADTKAASVTMPSYLLPRAVCQQSKSKGTPTKRCNRTLLALLVHLTWIIRFIAAPIVPIAAVSFERTSKWAQHSLLPQPTPPRPLSRTFSFQSNSIDALTATDAVKVII